MIYHPQQLVREQLWIKELIPLVREHSTGSFMTIDILNAVIGVLMELYNTELETIPIDERPMPNSQTFNSLITLFDRYERFNRQGSQVFDFHPTLTTLLGYTDSEDLRIDKIMFPYPAMYLHFGPQESLSLPPNQQSIEGAYVYLTGSKKPLLEITLVTSLPPMLTPHSLVEFSTHSSTYLNFSLTLPDGPFTIREAIIAFLAKEQPFTPHQSPDRSGTYEINEREIEFIDKRQETENKRVCWNMETFPILKRGLHLVLNCLCYLMTRERDEEMRFPENTPSSMLTKLARATTPKESARTTSKLTAMGYSRIHFCGHRTFINTPHTPSGRELTTHWRRGHLRNQAYGAQYSERRIVWIMPTLVRKDRGDVTQGHVYNVTP